MNWNRPSAEEVRALLFGSKLDSLSASAIMYAGSTFVTWAARTTVSASQRGTRICSNTSTSLGFALTSGAGVWAWPDETCSTMQAAAVAATRRAETTRADLIRANNMRSFPRVEGGAKSGHSAAVDQGPPTLLLG